MTSWGRGPGHFNSQNRDFLKYLKIFKTYHQIEEKMLYKLHIFKKIKLNFKFPKTGSENR